MTKATKLDIVLSRIQYLVYAREFDIELTHVTLTRARAMAMKIWSKYPVTPLPGIYAHDGKILFHWSEKSTVQVNVNGTVDWTGSFVFENATDDEIVKFVRQTLL